MAGDGMRMLSSREAAERLGVSVRTLQRWRQMDSGPLYVRYVSGRVAYYEYSVVKWLRDHEK